eukprot:Blabericola_migrator_1__7049@NODE_3578_length_1664_cov_247_534126_g2222_i0_p1_GENE_NODE_3578_length_1664_cov_247_534126_g2222_i0NODE_3578_length_1664_cov_247_534126_g2222_i0_p1_ORF_typecomplete_len134_score15_59Epiglycanin_C/PF14654_6/0_36S1FA/PF04689_13/0_84_NODE_3578_length_1664_cov_247_534126_g2222_i0539940
MRHLLFLALCCTLTAQQTTQGLKSLNEAASAEKKIDLLATRTCSRYDGKCKKCADQDMCSYCYATETCVENSLIGGTVCQHKKGWVSSKRHCSGYLAWWAILLIVLGCVCLTPLIGFLCFVYVIKKLCCGGGD